MESEISSCEFVSIQSNETTEVMCAPRLAMVLCYVKCGCQAERLYSLVNAEDRSAVGISEILQNILRLYSITEKLIAQAYYEAAVMSGSRIGVQALIKREYPRAHFCTVAPSNSTWVSHECVLITLCPVYFSPTCLVYPVF